MESQLVVDSVELSGSGFLERSARGSQATDEMWCEIKSLNHRANSRDREELALTESTDAERKYMLRLESRELRKQAQRLQKLRMQTLAAEVNKRAVPQESIQLTAPLQLNRKPGPLR